MNHVTNQTPSPLEPLWTGCMKNQTLGFCQLEGKRQVGWLALSCLPLVKYKACSVPTEGYGKNPTAFMTVTASWALKSSKPGTVWDPSFSACMDWSTVPVIPRREQWGQGLILLMKNSNKVKRTSPAVGTLEPQEFPSGIHPVLPESGELALQLHLLSPPEGQEAGQGGPQQ